MTNSNTFAETTIVAFHIGRGGRFHNAGSSSFIGEYKIRKFTNDLFLTHEKENEAIDTAKARIGEYIWDNMQLDGRNDMTSYCLDLITDEKYEDLEKIFGITSDDLGERVYKDCNGSQVGLTEREAMAGVGRINIDNDYNTTYTRYLSDCTHEELQLIAECNVYVDGNTRDYAKERLGIVGEEETETED